MSLIGKQRSTPGSTSARKTNPAAPAARVWNPTFEPLVAHLLQTHGVKIRPAVEVGKKAVDYFRGKDFVTWVSTHQETLLQKFPQCFLNAKNNKLDGVDITTLADELIRNRFIYRAEYQEVPGATTPTKWPKRLACSPFQKFEPESFYVVVYEVSSSWPFFLLMCLVGAVLAVCMFPAWPMAFRVGTWIVTVSFLTFLADHVLAVVVPRDGLLDLPQFLRRRESFIPWYSFAKRDDGWVMLFARIFLAILMGAACYQLSQTHSLSDVHRFATQQFLDIVEWGQLKLTAPPIESSTLKHAALPAEGDEPFGCMKPCGFADFEMIKDECIFDCQCMVAIIESHCYKKCPQESKTILLSAKDDTCEQEAINKAAEDEKDEENEEDHVKEEL